MKKASAEDDKKPKPKTEKKKKGDDKPDKEIKQPVLNGLPTASIYPNNNSYKEALKDLIYDKIENPNYPKHD